jgi:hypothetical protein
LAGSVFGLWRGFDFAQYSPAAYLEVHQGAVRGLDALLPVQGIVSIVIVAALAVGARRDRRQFVLLVVAALLLAAAGLVTRLGNQPINALVMNWTADTLPANWEALRDSWRNLHLLRTVCTMAALLLLAIAAVTERRG